MECNLPPCAIREIKAGRYQNAANMASISIEAVMVWRDILVPSVTLPVAEKPSRAPSGWSKFQLGRMYSRGLDFQKVGELLNASPFAVEDALKNRAGTTCWFRRRIEQVIDATPPVRGFMKAAAE